MIPLQTNTVPVTGGELQLQAEGPHLHPALPRSLRSPQHTQGRYNNSGRRLEIYPGFALIGRELLYYCALIGRELYSGEIFS